MDFFILSGCIFKIFDGIFEWAWVSNKLLVPKKNIKTWFVQEIGAKTKFVRGISELIE